MSISVGDGKPRALPLHSRIGRGTLRACDPVAILADELHPRMIRPDKTSLHVKVVIQLDSAGVAGTVPQGGEFRMTATGAIAKTDDRAGNA